MMRNKFFSIVNIFGLSVGLACCMLIALRTLVKTPAFSIRLVRSSSDLDLSDAAKAATKHAANAARMQRMNANPLAARLVASAF